MSELSRERPEATGLDALKAAFFENVARREDGTAGPAPAALSLDKIAKAAGLGLRRAEPHAAETIKPADERAQGAP